MLLYCRVYIRGHRLVRVPPGLLRRLPREDRRPKASIHAVAKCESRAVFCAAAPDYPHHQSRFRSRAKRSSSLFGSPSGRSRASLPFARLRPRLSSGHFCHHEGREKDPRAHQGCTNKLCCCKLRNLRLCRSAGHYSGNGDKVS